MARKKVEEVPQLADPIVKLKNELEIEKDKEQKLSKELENPQNENRWRELEGEDAE